MKNKTMPLVIAALVAIAAIVIAILILSSTGHKIKKLDKFATKVEQEYNNYSESDLEKAQAKFEKLVAKAEKKDLTGEQRSVVNELKGRCKGYFAQAKARMILRDFQDAVNEAGDEVKGAIESMQ
ncbi:MAG: hypothetical protein K6A41_08865 [Bacteroidales bacterium]|nr:hypothetical protein [Bacteroidales bacterium]